MSMFLYYIDAIKEKLHTQYGFPYADPERGPSAGVLAPDGEYPMEIEGKTDHVIIKDDKIQCCRWAAGTIVLDL